MNSRIIFLICGLIFLNVVILSSKNNFKKPESNINLEFGINYWSGTGYYNLNDSTNTTFREYKTINSQPDSADYSTELKAYIFNLGLKYKIYDNLLLSVKIPFGLFSGLETYKLNYTRDTQNFTNRTRGSSSIYQPLYYQFGSDFNFIDSGIIRPALRLEARIPPTFKNGFQSSQTDSNSLVRYESYELLFGGNLQFQFETSWLGLGIAYNLRDNVLKNQLLLHFEGGISTVPQTYLKTWTDIILSSSNFENAIPISSRRLGYQENSFNLGFAFKISFDKSFYSELSYELKYYGRNTWMFGILGLRSGFYL